MEYTNKAQVCPSTIQEIVCVQADVTITPHVEVKQLKTYCINKVKNCVCPKSIQEACTFSVSQSICVEIPLEFSATVDVVPKGIICGDPLTGAGVMSSYRLHAYSRLLCQSSK